MEYFDYCKPRFYRSLYTALKTDKTVKKDFLGSLATTFVIFLLTLILLLVVLFANLTDSYWNFVFGCFFCAIGSCLSLIYSWGNIKLMVEKVRQEMQYMRLEKATPEHQRERSRHRRNVHFRAASPTGSDNVVIDLFQEEGPPGYDEAVVEVPTTMASSFSSGACGYGSE